MHSLRSEFFRRADDFVIITDELHINDSYLFARIGNNVLFDTNKRVLILFYVIQESTYIERVFFEEGLDEEAAVGEEA